jgi:hypothetical protein
LADNLRSPAALAAKLSSNPKQRYERYVALAQNAALNGDEVATEHFYQHAEHYLRQMRET